MSEMVARQKNGAVLTAEHGMERKFQDFQEEGACESRSLAIVSLEVGILKVGKLKGKREVCL